jgi:hypothetical protein
VSLTQPSATAGSKANPSHQSGTGNIQSGTRWIEFRSVEAASPLQTKYFKTSEAQFDYRENLAGNTVPADRSKHKIQTQPGSPALQQRKRSIAVDIFRYASNFTGVSAFHPHT